MIVDKSLGKFDKSFKDIPSPVIGTIEPFLTFVSGNFSNDSGFKSNIVTVNPMLLIEFANSYPASP